MERGKEKREGREKGEEGKEGGEGRRKEVHVLNTLLHSPMILSVM